MKKKRIEYLLRCVYTDLRLRVNRTDHVGTKEALLGVGEQIKGILEESGSCSGGSSKNRKQSRKRKEREKRIKVRLCVPDEVRIEVVRIKGLKKSMVFSVRGFEGFVAI